jgi:hypothetical protein
MMLNLLQRDQCPGVANWTSKPDYQETSTNIKWQKIIASSPGKKK